MAELCASWNGLARQQSDGKGLVPAFDQQSMLNHLSAQVSFSLTRRAPLKKETSHSCVSDSAEKLNEQESTVRDPSLKAFPIKCFVFHHPVSCDGESVGPAKKREGIWVPEKARLLSKKAWLQSQLQNLGQVIHGSLFRPSNV